MIPRTNPLCDRTSQTKHKLWTFVLCILWSLACGCGQAPSPAQNPPATLTSPVSEKPAARPDDVARTQNKDVLALPTSTPANEEPQQTAGNTETAALKVRLPDERPGLNAARLAQAGIRRYESRRLILLSDLPEEIVAHLPAIADQLFDRLESHFGKLPASIDDSDFQVTGHLIDNEQAFRAAGLMPSETFTFDHGRHWNYQFWMFDTEQDYYRRHLLLHEFTHCFMTCECGMQQLPASWYMEGMAEFFATHRLVNQQGTPARVEFGVFPESFEDFEGWGRISEIRRSFQRRGSADAANPEHLTITTLEDVMPDHAKNFTQYSQYATSWALCWFLQTHPDYRDPFRSLATLRTGDEISETVRQLRGHLQPRLGTDWLLFVESLREHYDVNHSFPVHSKTPLTANDLKTGIAKFQVQADLDWQDSGLRLAAGESVNVKCTGHFSVNDQPHLWMSEPQGVSIEYFSGLPLGQVVATLVSDAGVSMTSRISVGTGKTIRTSQNVSVWLQVNDSSASRRNNAGTVDVEFSLP
ncbi:MAG: hypothetical protein P8J37_22520 [Fuerstiella sp.]|nr:hypothetical protein [Fuerstiella sp.]